MDAARSTRISLFLSEEHACHYLPGQRARLAFANPDQTRDPHVYSRLAEQGFRRSGAYLYRPQCEGCRACVPVRIPVDRFRPDRTQRRIWQRDQDLRIGVSPVAFHEEHYRLFTHYLRARHPGGGMDGSSESDYLNFLASPWNNTCLVEMRAGEDLVTVAVMDVLDEGLSAVYTFFDPAQARRSPGTFAILWLIEEARRRAMPHVYLGYWIAESPKMAYKDRFRPYEMLGDAGWERVD